MRQPAGVHKLDRIHQPSGSGRGRGHDRPGSVVLALTTFFAVCAGFVGVCERIIGPDPEGIALSTGPEEVVAKPQEAAA